MSQHANIAGKSAGTSLNRRGFLAGATAAGFTLMATLIANRFWALPPGPERFMMANGFFEHVGLVGGFCLVAIWDWSIAHSGRTAGQIEKDSDRDYYMSAAEALTYGIVDKVFETKNQAPVAPHPIA